MEDIFLANYNYYSTDNHFDDIKDVESIIVQGNNFEHKPLLSITIPTYKRVATLKYTLESAINQKGNHDYEIIVVDNNPEREDATEIFMRNYSSVSNLKYYKNAKNIGMGGNWCRCIDLANGTWVTLLHDDDLIVNDYLNQIEPCLFDRIDAVFVNQMTFKNGEELPIISTAKHFVLSKITILDQYHFPALGPSGNTLRKSKVVELGGFNGQIFAPDVFFTVLAYYGNVYKTDNALMYYRIGLNESTKYEAMDKMCYLNHFERIQTFQKIGVPNIVIKYGLLYSDVIFEQGFKNFWNKDFKYTSMPYYSKYGYFFSKFIYILLDTVLKVIRKIKREKIIIY